MSHGDLIDHYVPTQLRFTDIFTKSLPIMKILFLKSNMFVHLSIYLEGGDKEALRIQL